MTFFYINSSLTTYSKSMWHDITQQSTRGLKWLTLCGPFLDWPQELQEESWDVGLFHASPSSASHWPVFMPISSPPDPQPSCINLGPGKTPMDKTAHNQGCNQHIHFNLKPDRFIALLIYRLIWDGHRYICIGVYPIDIHILQNI